MIDCGMQLRCIPVDESVLVVPPRVRGCSWRVRASVNGVFVMAIVSDTRILIVRTLEGRCDLFRDRLGPPRDGCSVLDRSSIDLEKEVKGNLDCESGLLSDSHAQRLM